MKPCPVCGQTAPIKPLRVAEIRLKSTTFLKHQLRFWEKTLLDSEPLSRHHSKMKNRAMTRIGPSRNC